MLTIEQLKGAKYMGLEKGWVLPNGECLSTEQRYDVEGNRVLWYQMAVGFVIADKSDPNKIIVTLKELVDPEGYAAMKAEQKRKTERNAKWKSLTAKDLLVQSGVFERIKDFAFGKSEIDELVGEYFIDGFKVVEITKEAIIIHAYDPEENGSYPLDAVNYNRLGLISDDELKLVPENRRNFCLGN